MKRTDLLNIPVGNLKIVDGFNARLDYGDIDSLASSIAENGVKVPLRVYKDRGTDNYLIVDGHRRFKAVQSAIDNGLVKEGDLLLPCVLESKGSNEEDMVLGMILYNDGKRLNMLEEAEVYKRLINYGWDAVKIASKVGKTRTHIDNCLLLLSASTELKQKVISGEVSSSFVIEELRDSTSEEVVGNIEEAKKVTGAKKISKKHVDKVKEQKAPEPKVAKTALNFMLEKGLILEGFTKFTVSFSEDDERAGKDFELCELLEDYAKWLK